jgi:high frequency lysogenization protein
MSLKSLSNQTIALAGVMQACSLVNQIATTGNSNNSALTASIGSLLKIDSDSVADVYGGLIGVNEGLKCLQRQFDRNLARPELNRYGAQLLYLQVKLMQNPQMVQTIREGVARAQHQADHFGILHENVLANLADLYHSTISTLNPRILVLGDPQHLENPNVVNKIRATLLAGIRSALLWRQCGGHRWKLLLTRGTIRQQAGQLLSQLEVHA